MYLLKTMTGYFVVLILLAIQNYIFTFYKML